MTIKARNIISVLDLIPKDIIKDLYFETERDFNDIYYQLIKDQMFIRAHYKIRHYSVGSLIYNGNISSMLIGEKYNSLFCNNKNVVCVEMSEDGVEAWFEYAKD